MATDARADMTQAELLHFYLGMRLQSGDGNVPIRQILAAFPEYVRQRNAMRNMIREADDQIEAGRSRPLDIEQTINEVIQGLAAQGITD